MFRGITQTDQRSRSAARVRSDLRHVLGLHLGIQHRFGDGVEIDYGAGISPKWKDITFTIGGLYYTYPGAFDPPGLENDYFELKTGAAYTFGGKLTVSINNYWSPEFGTYDGNADAIEFGAGYAFAGKLFNFFTPTHQRYVWPSVEQRIARRLHLLERRADARFHGPLVCRYPLLGYQLSMTCSSGVFELLERRWSARSRQPSRLPELPQKHFPTQRAPFRRPFLFAQRTVD